MCPDLYSCRRSLYCLDLRVFLEPLPCRIIDAVPGDPTSEHKIRIYLTLERLAALTLHAQLALRRYGSLEIKVECGESRNPVPNRQSRCNLNIWARCTSRAGAYLNELACVVSIIVIRPRRRRPRCRRRCRCRRRRRRFLRRASGDRKQRANQKQ